MDVSAMAFASTNPTTGQLLRRFDLLSKAELETKLARAQSAFQKHRLTRLADRAAALLSAADLFDAEQERLAALMTLGMGKPIAQGRAEAAKCAAACRYYATHAERMLADEPLPDADGRCFIRYEPIGAVLAIMPWNFPFWQTVRFAAPALMAGNVGLLKPAENVPQCALALEDIFLRAGFAEGCFQNLFIEIKTVARVLEDSRVAAVTFTGSVRAGSEVAALAGRQIKRSVLELGGSDPFIVMPSSPLATTVAQAVKARVQNNGQSCIAAKRFIVHADIYDAFCEQFTRAFSRLRVGDPARLETEIGPLCQASAVDTLERQVHRAIEAGARVLVGGKRLTGPGFFFEPTILADLPPASAAAREEFFGPVALLFRARDFDDALAIANDTPFGLGASIWTQHEAEQQRAIRELQAGQVFVNDMVGSQPALPFGGIRQSGCGRELGVAGMREFLNAKSVRVAAVPAGTPA